MSYCRPLKRGVSWRSQNFGDNATIYGPHSGNDDAAPIGTPVHAAGDGFVDWAGEFDDTYLDNLLWLLKMGGNILVLNCGANEPSFVYGHLNSFTVKRGDWVRKGQVIAYSGNTGTATTGAHLHTEAIPPGYALNSPMLGRVNPDIYLTEWPEDIGTGSLSYAGTITPIQSEEDELNKDQDGALGTVFSRTNQAPAAGLIASQGDINVVLSRLGRLEDALFEALGKPQPEPSAVLVKGDQDSTVYAWDGGTGYRALDYNEFAALMASGAELRTVEQTVIAGGSK